MQVIDSNKIIGIRVKTNGSDFQIAQGVGQIGDSKKYRVMSFASKDELDKFINKLKLLRKFFEESENNVVEE